VIETKHAFVKEKNKAGMAPIKVVVLKCTKRKKEEEKGIPKIIF
jgi:hypothetical protein